MLLTPVVAAVIIIAGAMGAADPSSGVGDGGEKVMQALVIGFQVGFAGWDRTLLKASRYKNPPLFAAVILPPAYFWRRYRITSAGLGMFRISLITIVLLVLLAMLPFYAERLDIIAYSLGLESVPSCEHSKPDVIRILGDNSYLKSHSSTVSDVKSIKEVSLMAGKRTCSASLMLSDNENLPIAYTIEHRDDGHFYILVQDAK